MTPPVGSSLAQRQWTDRQTDRQTFRTTGPSSVTEVTEEGPVVRNVLHHKQRRLRFATGGGGTQIFKLIFLCFLPRLTVLFRLLISRQTDRVQVFEIAVVKVL